MYVCMYVCMTRCAKQISGHLRKIQDME